MQHVTSKRLFQYWDHVRGTRRAPRRFEIEPSAIAELLPETFIAEHNSPEHYYFRLAGTQITHKFGRELRATNFLDFWSSEDLEGVKNLMNCVVQDAAIGVMRFRAATETGDSADFEITMLPLVHSGEDITRLLGNISPTSRCHGLGMAPLKHFALRDIEMVWPDFLPDFMLAEGHGAEPDVLTPQYSRIVRSDRRCFRVYEGGLSSKSSSSV